MDQNKSLRHESGSCCNLNVNVNYNFNSALENVLEPYKIDELIHKNVKSKTSRSKSGYNHYKTVSSGLSQLPTSPPHTSHTLNSSKSRELLYSQIVSLRHHKMHLKSILSNLYTAMRSLLSSIQRSQVNFVDSVAPSGLMHTHFGRPMPSFSCGHTLKDPGFSLDESSSDPLIDYYNVSLPSRITSPDIDMTALNKELKALKKSVKNLNKRIAKTRVIKSSRRGWSLGKRQEMSKIDYVIAKVGVVMAKEKDKKTQLEKEYRRCAVVTPEAFDFEVESREITGKYQTPIKVVKRRYPSKGFKKDSTSASDSKPNKIKPNVEKIVMVEDNKGIFDTTIEEKCLQDQILKLKEKIQKRTLKVLNTAECARMIGAHDQFRANLVSHYQDKLQKQINIHIDRCSELKQLKEKNRLLKVDVERFRQMNVKRKNQKRRGKSANK